jgi:TRAP transporter TAXI family solute receptor
MKTKLLMGALLGAVIAPLAGTPALGQTIDFLGAQNGSYSFTVMYAATAIINQNSDKLKGVVHETFGASDNLKRLDQDKELRKHAFAATTIPAQYSAMNGTPKAMFPTPIKGLLQVFNTADFCAWIAVSDPDIKKVEDLAGKRFDAGPYGNFLGSIGDSILQAYGVKDKLRSLLHTADQAAQYEAFGDGKVDGILAGGVVQGAGGVAYNATATKLLASRTIWPVSISPEKVKETAKISGIPFAPCSVKAGSPNPKAPAYTSISYAGNVVAHADMPEELVYQAVKLVIAHVEEFGKYAGQAKKAMTKDTLAAINVPVSEFHPGAVRAYREAGIKVGEENFQ